MSPFICEVFTTIKPVVPDPHCIITSPPALDPIYPDGIHDENINETPNHFHVKYELVRTSLWGIVTQL